MSHLYERNNVDKLIINSAHLSIDFLRGLIAEPETPNSMDSAAAKEEDVEENDVADPENPETFDKNSDSSVVSATDPRSLKEDQAIRKAMEAIIGNHISVSYKKGLRSSCEA